jgi:hypothetical protein
MLVTVLAFLESITTAILSETHYLYHNSGSEEGSIAARDRDHLELVARGGLSFHFGGGVLDSLDYMLIASAPAQVAFEAMANFVLAWTGVSCQDLGAAHDHSGRAIPALKSVVFPEPLLHWMKLAIAGHAFDRGDLAAVSLNGKHRAGFHGFAAQGNRAGATD